METLEKPQTKSRFDALHISLIVILAVLVTAIASYWVITTYIFPKEFKPVTLSAGEQRVLDEKLERLDSFTPDGSPGSVSTDRTDRPDGLQPERYSEDDDRRVIQFTERELNSLLATNTDLARKLAVDLSDDLVSAKLLVHMDEDFPILGGKILKLKAGVELAYRDGRPLVVLKGISVMGVPLPNAWIGNIKNIDLVDEFGGERGFWKAFADGVERIDVGEGRLSIRLKE